MKNRYMIRKYAAILVLSVVGIVSTFAQGAVVGYANPNGVNNSGYPSNDQLDKLTHVIAVDIGVNPNGTLKYGSVIKSLPNNWSGYTNTWLTGFVSRAHAKGVKVSICISGEGEFATATSGSTSSSSSNISKFIDQIVSFVNANGLDGVNIDWESPSTSSEWTQCVNLLTALKNKPELSCKIISIAPIAKHPDTPPMTPSQIWGQADAIYLMTYDQTDWLTHSLDNSANNLSANKHIGLWEVWGTPRGLDKKKLHVGCAFYGYNKDASGNTIWKKIVSGESVPAHVPYHSGGSTCGNPGDNTNDIISKVSNSYTKGYGGVMFWELSYDLADATNSNSLLNATWAANTTNGGCVSTCIGTCPTLTYSTSPVSSGITTVNHEGDIIIQNVTVKNGVTLQFTSSCNKILNNVTVKNGAKLILKWGEVTINEIDIQEGAEFEIIR